MCCFAVLIELHRNFDPLIDVKSVLIINGKAKRLAFEALPSIQSHYPSNFTIAAESHGPDDLISMPIDRVVTHIGNPVVTLMAISDSGQKHCQHNECGPNNRLHLSLLLSLPQRIN